MRTATDQSILPNKNMASWKILLFQLFFASFFILPLIGFEFILIGLGYGVDPEPFQPSPWEDGYFVENPNYVFKFHPALPSQSTLLKNRDATTAFQTRFSKQKPPGTLRGFVIGESTAKGFPYLANHSFGPIAARAFVGDGPNPPVEIINAAFSAMTSYYLVDIAHRLPNYDPDFVVIYAGHNEFYGTISYSTGGFPWAKHLFVGLRNFRVFQWLTTAFASPVERDPSVRLMEKRFQKQLYPLDPARDEAVAQQFLNNLDEVVTLLTSRGIRVYLYEPVSNLLSMPPFRGSTDEAADLVRRIVQSVGTQDLPTSQKLFEEARSLESRLGPQPDLSYLRSHFQAQRGLFKIEDFKQAKDQDWVPFRARESLIEGLRIWASRAMNNDLVHFLPTFELLTDRFGEKIFSRSFFLEHVHPNIEGHVALAKILADQLIADYPLLVNDLRLAFFENRTIWSQAIHYKDIFEIASLRSMINLGTSEPYVSMRIPAAVLWQERMAQVPLFYEETFQNALRETEAQEPIRAYFSYLEILGSNQKKAEFLSDLAYLYPGSRDYWQSEATSFIH